MLRMSRVPSDNERIVYARFRHVNLTVTADLKCYNGKWPFTGRPFEILI